MRILIVGGTGFVGKSFADWASRGNDVESVVLASRQPEKTAGTSFLGTVARHKKVVLTTTGTDEFWSHAIACDGVIYAASSSDARDYQSGEQVAALDLSNLRIFLDRHKVDKPLLYLSSGAVYGKQPAAVECVAEDQEPWPDEPGKALYALIKRQAETAILEFATRTGCRVAIARLFAFCGAWLPTDQHFLIGNLIGSVERRSPLELKAPFPVFRSYMSGDGLSAAMYAQLVGLQAEGIPVVVNVGSDQAEEMHEFGQKLAESHRLAYLGHSSNSLGRDRVDRYVPSIERMKVLMGCQAVAPLDTVVSETLQRRAELGLRP